MVACMVNSNFFAYYARSSLASLALQPLDEEVHLKKNKVNISAPDGHAGHQETIFGRNRQLVF